MDRKRRERGLERGERQRVDLDIDVLGRQAPQVVAHGAADRERPAARADDGRRERPERGAHREGHAAAGQGEDDAHGTGMTRQPGGRKAELGPRPAPMWRRLLLE